MEIRRKRKSGAFLIVLALLAFIFMSRSPQFPTMRYVDMVLLMASGACAGLGVARLLESKSE